MSSYDISIDSRAHSFESESVLPAVHASLSFLEDGSFCIHGNLSGVGWSWVEGRGPKTFVALQVGLMAAAEAYLVMLPSTGFDMETVRTRMTATTTDMS